MNELYEKGLEIRREVLGDEYVDQSLANSDEFMKPFQEMVTSYCWGAIWSREGLSRRERSLINLAMLTALNRPHEIELHVKGAIRNGVTREEIIEVFLQAGVYAGIPAALDSFRIGRDVAMREQDSTGERNSLPDSPA